MAAMTWQRVDTQAVRFVPPSERVLQDVRAISSGTLGTLTGKSRYDELDGIHNDWIMWTWEQLEAGRTFANWKDAWESFVAR